VCDRTTILISMHENGITFNRELKRTHRWYFLITSGRAFHKAGPMQVTDNCFVFKRVGWLLY